MTINILATGTSRGIAAVFESDDGHCNGASYVR